MKEKHLIIEEDYDLRFADTNLCYASMLIVCYDFFQLVVTKTNARGFPTRLGRWQAGRAPVDDFWVDVLVQKLRHRDRQVGWLIAKKNVLIFVYRSLLVFY